MEEAAEEVQGLTNLIKAAGSSEAGGKATKTSCDYRFIDGLPDEIVLAIIAPKLIDAWDFRLLMLKQVNQAWRSLLASCRGLLGPFRVEWHIVQLAIGNDAFSDLKAYDAGCKEWRNVHCFRIASRIAVQEDGLKVYSIGEQGICVLNLTGSDEHGIHKYILGNGTKLAWKTLMPCGHKHWVDDPDASKSVAIIQGRFVYGEADRSRANSGILCFHVFDIEQGKWDKIMVSKRQALSKYNCCMLKHRQRGCLLVLDHQDKELLVYDVIALQERRHSFSIHVEGGKNLDMQIREAGDGSRVFAQGRGEDKHLLAFASLDVLLDEGKLKFDEFLEQVNVPEGHFLSLRNDHVGGCHAILEERGLADDVAYLWRGRYVDTDTNKKLVWEERGVELESTMHYSYDLI